MLHSADEASRAVLGQGNMGALKQRLSMAGTRYAARQQPLLQQHLGRQQQRRSSSRGNGSSGRGSAPSL